MGFFANSLNWASKRMGYQEKVLAQAPKRRGYEAGGVGDLMADFIRQGMSADAEINPTLSKIRARSRDQWMNNDYFKHWLRIMRVNVVGPDGIRLQMKSRNEKGKLDVADNRAIERAWKKFSKKKNFSVCGRFSFTSALRMVCETVARDGEIIIRKVVPYPNDFNFALQFIEADHLDENDNRILSNGNRVKMGVEVNAWDRPVAYWILPTHPGDMSRTHENKPRVRVSADEIIHLFWSERPGQTRGVPWAHSAIKRFKMLGGYEEAELVAARIGASKIGVVTKPQGEEYDGDGSITQGEEGEGGREKIIDEVSPGHWEQLPDGYKMDMFDPQHPAGNFAPFVKTILRGAAAGLGLSYNTLANDLESVNFSSMRSGKLDERDIWREQQAWLIEDFIEEIFSGGSISWLPMALLSNAIPGLPFSKLIKFDAATWRPRGWLWVDPVKEEKANTEGLQNKSNSLTRILAQKGIDIEDHLDELKAEQELADEKGVIISLDKSPTTPLPEEESEKEDEKEKTKNES